MIKKIIIVFLNIILSFCCLMPTWITGAAQGARGAFALTFSLQVDGQSVVVAEQGDVVTVSFRIQRADSDGYYTTNGFQNYIHYDLAFFEYVEDSIVCYDTGATAKKQDSLTYQEIIQCQNMGKTYAADFVFCTFQLRVIGSSGSGTVENDEVQAFDENLQEVTVVKQDLQVKINDCAHTTKIKVAAKQPTCEEDGNEAYSYCDECGLFFDEEGENRIASVPFIDGGHDFSKDVAYDANGHWHACTVCGEKSDVALHSGGKATCVAKAVCEVCGQGYGDIDADNHTGETFLKNEKEPTSEEDGYTGDVYCADCQQLLEAGETIPQETVPQEAATGGPWSMLIIGIVLLLVVAVIVCLVSSM